MTPPAAVLCRGMEPLRLNPSLDVHALAASYRTKRRVVIDHFLDEGSAAALHRWATSTSAWLRVLNGGDTVFEIPEAAFAAMAEEERQRLDAAVIAAARTGFQYRYASIRVDDDPRVRTARGLPVDAFAALMGAPATLALLRAITGEERIDFADAQATAYHAGDFLTAHDDAVSGKGRRAAYVLGLNPAWRPEWGGLLLFHEGAWLEGIVPGYNRLSLFGVPQTHSVSSVTPAAAAPRFSITGWLRAAGQA